MEMINYRIEQIKLKQAKEYIIQNHYSKTCGNQGICYGLFDDTDLIGVIIFAMSASNTLQEQLLGRENKKRILELHRLHIKDCTPKNTESWFISRTLKLIKEYKPELIAIVTFSDPTEGHEGIVYKATNAIYLGKTTQSGISYRDTDGKLRHRKNHDKTISISEAKELGWKVEKRLPKHKFIYLLGNRREKRYWTKQLYSKKQ